LLRNDGEKYLNDPSIFRRKKPPEGGLVIYLKMTNQSPKTNTKN